MAIDLQNPQNIDTGWKPPTMFHADSIGSLVSGILSNRLGQQELQQKNIAAAIKQYQSQRSDAAYIQAAQNSGVLPPGDYSGMSAASASDLAQRIQDQQQTSQEKYYDALTKVINDTGKRPGTAGGSGGNTVSVYGDDGTYVGEFPAGSVVARNYVTKHYGLGPDLTAGQASALAKALGVPDQDFFDPSRHAGYQSVPGGVDRQGNQVPLPLSPDQDPSEADHIGITPSAPNPATGLTTPVIVPRSMFTRIRTGLTGPDAVTRQGVRQPDVDQASQAPGVTPTRIPYDNTIPTPTPGASPEPSATPGTKVAKGYGVQATYMKAPDGTVSPVDPNLVEYYKSKGAVVVQGP